jgi:hypothetical protein
MDEDAEAVRQLILKRGPVGKSTEEYNREVDATLELLWVEQVERRKRKREARARNQDADSDTDTDSTYSRRPRHGEAEDEKHDGIPRTDLEAFNIFYALDPNIWRHAGSNKFYTYNKLGIWKKEGNEDALRKLRSEV